MNKEEISEYLADFQELELPLLIERDLSIPDTGKIKSIIGPRRAGKTYFMFQEMKKLMEKESKKNILYLNFEDPRLISIGFKEVNEIVKLHWELYPESTKGKFHVFIDEPQNIKKWDAAVRNLHDRSFDVWVSGSSSKLLSKEIATSLRGRTLSFQLLPFSFKEFLKIMEGDFDIIKLSSKKKSLLLNKMAEFLDYGGYPEVISEENEETKIRILSEYLDMIIYRDIVERYDIKNTKLIRWLIKSLIDSFCNEFSVHKLYNTLKSKGIKVSKNTLYSYLSMLEDSLFVFFLSKFSYSARKDEISHKKTYLCDTGFSQFSGRKDKGKKLENAVFLELKRKQDKNPLMKLSFWQDKEGREVDFVVEEKKKKKLIQTCYNPENEKTKEREIKSLLKASESLNCNNLSIVTRDYEGKEKINGKKVEFISFWRWSL